MYAESVLPSPLFWPHAVFFLYPNRLLHQPERPGTRVATNAYLSLGADQQVNANIFASHYLWNIPYTYI